MVATALPDELTVELSTGLGADLLDETGELDSEAAIAALGGWSELLMPGLTELAGDDPELLALLEAFARSDDLEAAVQAELAAALEDAAPTNEPPNEGLGPMGFLSAVRGPGEPHPWHPRRKPRHSQPPRAAPTWPTWQCSSTSSRRSSARRP